VTPLVLWPFGKRKAARNRFEREAMPHIDAVYRFALSLTRDHVDADDLVQETFLKGLRAFDTFQEGTNCKAWLFRILRNTHINRLRAGAREVGIEDAAELVAATTLAGWSERSFYRGPEAAAALAATREQLEAALETLPPDFRAAVVMADVEGLSYKEIAEVMGTPIGTVMSRLYRGRRMMRERLTGSLGMDVGVEDGAEVVSLDARRRDREDGNGL